MRPLGGVILLAAAALGGPVTAQGVASTSVQIVAEPASVRFDPDQPPTALNFGNVPIGSDYTIDAGTGAEPNSGEAARFSVLGPPFQAYSISLPSAPVFLVNAATGVAGPVQLTEFETNVGSPQVSFLGADTFYVGARVFVDSTAGSGFWSGTYTVTIANQ